MMLVDMELFVMKKVYLHGFLRIQATACRGHVRDNLTGQEAERREWNIVHSLCCGYFRKERTDSLDIVCKFKIWIHF